MTRPTALLSRPPAWPAARVARDRAVLVAGTALAALVVGVTTVRSPQLGCATALVLFVVAAYLGRPAAGLGALWVVWLLAPGIRRVFGLELGYLQQDPLSVAPFAATAAIAAIAAARTRLPRKVGVLLLLVLGGLALGLPSGAGNPSAATFALLAYAAGVGAFVLGWREGAAPLRRWSVVRALLIGAPLLAVYGLVQYFVALPSWDVAWLDAVEFSSIGAPEEGKVRVFASLNAPGVLAFALALAIILQVSRRPSLPALLAVGVMALALAVTYVRSAWLSLAVAAVVLVLASRGRALPQVLGLVVALALAVGALSTTGGGTYGAFVDRVSTLGSLESDVSATERQATPLELIPQLAVQPFGFGLGSAGEASLRLSDERGLAAPDNGYLSMAYQLGLPGALLVIAGLLTAMWWALRGAFRRADPDRVLLTAIFAFFLVGLAAGDQFYGFIGAMLWFLVGAATSRSLSASSPR